MCFGNPIRFKNINNIYPYKRNLNPQNFQYFIERNQIFHNNYLEVILLTIES